MPARVNCRINRFDVAVFYCAMLTHPLLQLGFKQTESRDTFRCSLAPKQSCSVAALQLVTCDTRAGIAWLLLVTAASLSRR